MKKIYKYRPLSELLYKELYYQELYFASYQELNDPLDLAARIDFKSKDIEAINYLVNYLIDIQISFEILHYKAEEITLKILRFSNNKTEKDKLAKEIFKLLEKISNEEENVWIDDFIDILDRSFKNTQAHKIFHSNIFRLDLERLANKFLKSSYVCCFSETNDDFLMWSHYASKHSGICLEFKLDDNEISPNEYSYNRTCEDVKNIELISDWNNKSTISRNRIRKVIYQENQPFINFFDFSLISENGKYFDIKAWRYKYQQELEIVFATKTKSWEYENEWRAIEINIDNQREPEERIKHYPIESLSSVYFGVNTPDAIRNRIYKILFNKKSDTRFFESKLTGTNLIQFERWKYKK